MVERGIKMRDRNKQKQIWSSKAFAEELERIKAEMLINGKKVNNIGQLTEEIVRCESFKNLRMELLGNKLKSQLTIKLDKKRI